MAWGNKMLSASGLYDIDKSSMANDSQDVDGDEFCLYYPNGDIAIQRLANRALEVIL